MAWAIGKSVACSDSRRESVHRKRPQPPSLQLRKRVESGLFVRSGLQVETGGNSSGIGALRHQLAQQAAPRNCRITRRQEIPPLDRRVDFGAHPGCRDLIGQIRSRIEYPGNFKNPFQIRDRFAIVAPLVGNLGSGANSHRN